MLDSITRNLFISYAREDKPIADTLYAYLKPLIAQGKLRVFIDTEEIEKGEEWHKKITAQLHQADAFLFLVSQHYFRSNYVIETELPAMIKRNREDQVTCWPFLVSDYPWDDFVIDGFHLAGIQAIGPFDGNKRLIPLNALSKPEQDSQFRHVYTEVREWIEKLDREERQKHKALARQQEQEEDEGKRREQEKPSSADGSGSEKATPAPSFRYLWLVIVSLVVVAFIGQVMNYSQQMRQDTLTNAAEQARVEAERKTREEAEAQERARAAAEAASQRQAREVAELLAQAARQIDADRLTYPPGDNALETIHQALENQPDNARARELLEAILERYLQLAQGAMVKKEFDKGRQYLDKARRVDADSSRLAEVQNELDTARRAGAGSFRDTLSSGGKDPEMVWIPAGSFMMGSPESESDRGSDEGPRHKVQIRSFALGKTEVTFDDYDRFADATARQRPDDNGWGRGSRPVINVSWEDAVAYAEWLSGETGRHYRLPSEAEWEYAARAGTETERYWPTPAEGEPNDWRQYDILGNVWECVQDCYVNSYQGAPGDGTPREVDGTCENRVLRGGSWDNGPLDVRSANRNRSAPVNRINGIGFRLARTN